MPSPEPPRSTTPRRRLLAVAASTATAAAIAGCLTDAIGSDPQTPDDGPAMTESTTRAVTATGTYADAPSGPKSYPDRPTDASKAASVAFAEAFENARTYDSLHESDAETVSTSASTHHHRAMHDGHYVLATASGDANYDDGVHADWGQVPAVYYVSSDLVVRTGRYQDYDSDCEDVFASDDPSENFAAICEGGDAAFRGYNMHPDAHTVSVTVDYRGENRDERILEDEYFLGTNDAVQQGSVTYREGTYHVTAALESGAKATYDWTLQTEPTYDDPPLCVVVEPTGGLTIRRIPFDEL